VISKAAPSSRWGDKKLVDKNRTKKNAYAQFEEKLVKSLMARSASYGDAVVAFRKLVSEVRNYVSDGSLRGPTAKQMRREIGKVAGHCRRVSASVDSLSADAGRCLSFSDIQLSADLASVRKRLEMLASRLERASNFPVSRGRKRNPSASHFLDNAICICVVAAGRPPSGSVVHGQVTDGLLRYLRLMVNASTEDQDLRETISDHAFLSALKRYKLKNGTSVRPRNPEG
jgi:hypothetical protein